MKKTRFLSSVLVLCLFGAVDAFAAPTVKRLGTNTARVGSNASVVTSKPSVSANDSQRLSSMRSNAVAGGVASTSLNAVPAKQLNSASTMEESRLSLGKYINPNIGAKIPTSTTPGATTPGVSSNDFVNLTDRVSDVENKMDLKQEKISAGEGLVLENNTISIDEDLAELPNRIDTLSDDIDGLSAEMETKVSGDELDEFANGYYTKDEIDAKVEGIVVGNVGGLLDGKQDAITDLNDIRSGAASGKTAVQPAALNAALSGYATKDDLNSKADANTFNNYLTISGAAATYQPIGDYATADSLNAKADASALNNYLTTSGAAQTYQPIGNYATTDSLNSYYTKTEVDKKVADIVAGDMSSALEGKQDTITDLAAIRSGAQAGNTAVQPETLNNYLTTSGAAATYQPIGDYATADALNAKADASALNSYLTTTNAAATYQPIGDYATADALNAKADASALNNYLTTTNAAQTYQPIGNYATVDALNAKLDAADLSGYLTTVNAAQTYQPIGAYISNPELPNDSGDFMLVVNRDENGAYVYSWKPVTASSDSGSSSGSGGWDFDDSNW